MYKIVEKKNRLAVHAHCTSKESAQAWINEKAALYCKLGYFTDKKLKPNSFKAVRA